MARHMGADKDTEVLVKAARKQWGTEAVRLTKGNHIQFIPPEGEIIVGALTGCKVGQRNLRARLKRAGLEAAA